MDDRLILVAEDNRVNQLVMTMQLKSMGYASKVAANGIEVIEAVKEQAPALILMDCQMPLMDGLEATRQVRQLCAENAAHIPIIAVTAHAILSERHRCIAAGMDDYITKPVNFEKLKNDGSLLPCYGLTRLSTKGYCAFHWFSSKGFNKVIKTGSLWLL